MNELEKQFCIKECTEWVLSNKFSKVGLEFPDDPQMAVAVSQLLKKEIGISPIVLQDSNRACGNCCVDERTAKPRNIEAIIHFGSTCLTPTISLQVLFILNCPLSLDVEKLTQALLTENGPKEKDDLILFYDVRCFPFISQFSNHLKKHFPNLICSTLVIPKKAQLLYHKNSNLFEDFETDLKITGDDEEGRSHVFNYRQIDLPSNKSIDDYEFIYVGPNTSTLVSLQMRFSNKLFYIVNPVSNELSVTEFVKTVMGRSKKIEQVKEAKTVGILFTLVQNFQEIINRLKKLIKLSGKRSYTFFMGKINEAKLGNIVGIDVFVYVGCPESSLFDRIQDPYLYKNIVTPWEVEVALNPKYKWNLNFETDFTEILAVELEQKDEPIAVDINTYKQVNGILNEREDNNTALVERNPGTLYKLHENAAGEVVSKLTWQGLNPKEESSVPLGTVVEGRKGIAMQYETEMN